MREATFPDVRYAGETYKDNPKELADRQEGENIDQQSDRPFRPTTKRSGVRSGDADKGARLETLSHPASMRPNATGRGRADPSRI